MDQAIRFTGRVLFLSSNPDAMRRQMGGDESSSSTLTRYVTGASRLGCRRLTAGRSHGDW